MGVALRWGGLEIMLDFRILGPFEVVDGDRHIELGKPQQRALLAVLVLHRGEVVSSDRLIEELWNGRPPATAAKIVQGYVSHLRKVLGEEVLLTRGGGYLLAVEAEQVDAERFARLVAGGRHALADADPSRARDLLALALGLWRGEALSDMAYEPFARDGGTRLEEDRIDAELQLGATHGLVAEVESLVRRHPTRERLLGQLMLALYRSGRQAEALDAYRRGRQALLDELGLQPGPELRRLEQRILDQEPALDLPVKARAAPASDAHPPKSRSARARHGIRLALGGGALLLVAAIAAAVTELAPGRGATLRVPPDSVAGINVKSNRVDAAVAVGAQPDAITYGSGSLWVTNVDDQTISRVDPHSLQTLRTISLTQPPTAIAAAGGAIWTATSSATQNYVSVSQINPFFDTVVRTVRVGNVDPTSPAALAAHQRQVWVAPFSGDLTRLNATTGAVTQRIDPNTQPAGLAVGAGGMWMTDSEADAVVRIDATGLATTIDVGHQPDGIAIGAGAVWVAETGDNSVLRIDPTTHAATATITVGDNPRGITFGDGSVWVANSGDGTVSRINPHTDRVSATIGVGGSPQAVVVADGRAWVTVAAPVLARRVAASGGTLRIDASYDVDYMDPALAYESLSFALLRTTCALLLNYPDRPGPAGTALVPEVAASMPKVSDGGRTYTFVVRSGFRFAPPSNQPVTAQTFKDTIERTLSPVMPNPVVSEFYEIAGARSYKAGRAKHISGVVVRGNRLIIHLVAPDPVLPSLLAQPFFCAVPPATPRNPAGVRVIPSAGPYTTASYVPGQGIVLVRNPNYHGDRPHRFRRIEVSVNVPGPRAVAQVESGKADYAFDGEVSAADAPTLAARYGSASAAAKRGHQQYFVTGQSQLDFYFLNTHRPLFSHQRLREAVNYALDRQALAHLGDMHSTLPDQPLDSYLPPGIPGHRNIDLYPSTPDLLKAKRLAKGYAGSTVVLYTCDRDACGDQAQVIRSDLAAIGLRLTVKAFSIPEIYRIYNIYAARYDMGVTWWLADYPDPYDFLNLLLEDGGVLPTFKDPTYARKLAAAARLTGVDRYLTYGRLAQELAAKAAPWVAFGDSATHELFSARVGCHIASPILGTDIAALCLRRKA